MTGNNILEFTREQVKAMGQSGLMHINSVKHWDVCDRLRQGKTIEAVAEEMRLPFDTVVSIKRKKCAC